MFRVSRQKRGPDRFLNLKIVLFCLGAGIATVGIISQKTWIINVAIGVLLIGVILRFFSRDKTRPPVE
jgi:hypothetical protein